ncbi:MAG: hypothetical protein KIT33_08725 [Candidatus Kapabacteria bacterium]|nr:hypothetical protein [Ignavibacteriota bacterium]MCW5885039.1 hypothetical protein [Candidatus Kapabacteria bacterium]
MATSRIDDLRLVDPVLTTIAQGYENPAFIAEILFPTVTVSKLKGKIPSFGKDAFVVRSTDRAVRASSNRIQPADFELVTFETRERDIETAIDYLEEEESPDYFRYEQRIAKNLGDILKLGKEKDAADLAQNTSNYSLGMVEELAEADAFNNYDSSVNPLDVINDAMNSVRNKIARYPNTIVMGISVYNALLAHPNISSLVQYSGLAKVTDEILTKLLNIDTIHVGMSVHTEDGNTFSDIWGGNVILAYVDKSPKGKRNEFNPSWGYTFQREGMPEIDTYYENGGKIKVIRNTDNYGIAITGSDAAFLIKGAFQTITEGE